MLGLIAIFVLLYWFTFKDWDRVLRNHRNKKRARNTLGVKTYLDYKGTPREVKSNKIVSVGTDLKTGHRCVWYLDKRTGKRTLAKDINQDGQDQRWAEYLLKAKAENHPYVICDKNWEVHTSYGDRLIKGHRYREVATGNIYLKRYITGFHISYEIFTDLYGNYKKLTPLGEKSKQEYLDKSKEMQEILDKQKTLRNPYSGYDYRKFGLSMYFDMGTYIKCASFEYCLNEWNERKKKFLDRGDLSYKVANYGYYLDPFAQYHPTDYIDDHRRVGIDMNFSKK